MMAVDKDEYDTILRVMVRYLDAASYFGAGKDTLLPICERLVEGDLQWNRLPRGD